MTRFESNTIGAGVARLFSQVATVAVLLVSTFAHAGIDGTPFTNGEIVNLSASEGYISIADGGSVYSWGYSLNNEDMQLPGPTLIVPVGATINVELTNKLPLAAGNVSIVFPGLTVISTTGGEHGGLTQEAPTGGSVTYTIEATEPGTYQYHSGSQPDLQVEMGLYGAIIVEPPADAACPVSADGFAHSAYGHPGTCFDREYLFLLSEVDIDIHQAAEQQVSGAGPIILPAGAYHSEYWLINGRAAPDTLAAPGRALLPTQPYNIIPKMHPGEKLLLRLVGAGRELHPFHTHGNHVRVLANDGRLLVSATDPTNKLAGPMLFTIPTVPGGTTDAIFEWTGRDLGWDMYGTTDTNPHTCDSAGIDTDGYYTVGVSRDPASVDPLLPFAANYGEYCADHDEPIPVTLPSLSSLAFGGFYSGSPYLGALGSLPPGEGGLNPNAGFTYMWHSHNERELVNNDVFPGGMLTMLIIEAPEITIPTDE